MSYFKEGKSQNRAWLSSPLFYKAEFLKWFTLPSGEFPLSDPSSRDEQELEFYLKIMNAWKERTQDIKLGQDEGDRIPFHAVWKHLSYTRHPPFPFNPLLDCNVLQQP